MGIDRLNSMVAEDIGMVLWEQLLIPYRMGHFEHTLRVDRPPSAFLLAARSFLPATQGQRSTDQQGG
jgi:hypothetical protein